MRCVFQDFIVQIVMSLWAVLVEQEVGCHVTSRPTHAPSDTPPPPKKKNNSVSNCEDCREGTLISWSTCGHVSYYHRNLWTDTGTAALGI